MPGLNMNRSGASAELKMESTIRMMERYLGLIQNSGDFPPGWTSFAGDDVFTPPEACTFGHVIKPRRMICTTKSYKDSDGFTTYFMW